MRYYVQHVGRAAKYYLTWHSLILLPVLEVVVGVVQVAGEAAPVEAAHLDGNQAAVSEYYYYAREGNLQVPEPLTRMLNWEGLLMPQSPQSTSSQ